METRFAWGLYSGDCNLEAKTKEHNKDMNTTWTRSGLYGVDAEGTVIQEPAQLEGVWFGG